jgi:choline dehydrogenase-like flavoprotein
MTSAEHLVVGSGAGGAITAALLAEAGRDVLVLEEGPRYEPGAFAHFSLEQMAAQYRDGGVSAALGRPPVAYVEGRCVGGGTEVNAGLYHLADPEILARWRTSHAVADLTPEVLAPFARANERALSVQLLPHAAARGSLLLVEGAAALGWPAREVPRWCRYEGERAVRQTMTRTYLPRAERSGARVMSGVRADRLAMRDGRARGVHTNTGLVTAEHVWLCAGAIGSPALLRRSGLRHPAAGRLQLHPTVKVVAEFEEPIDAAADVAVHQVKPDGSRVSFGGSASRPGQVALALADDWTARRDRADDWRRMAVYYAAIRPHGRGRLRACRALRDPLVTFALTRSDMQLLRGGLADLTRLMFAAGATAVYPGVRGGGEVRRGSSPDTVAAGLSRSSASVMSVHLFSTLPLGEDQARCPVDSFGRVRETQALRVNDASLLPDAPGINPQGTIMAIAARNVAAFLSG